MTSYTLKSLSFILFQFTHHGSMLALTLWDPYHLRLPLETVMFYFTKWVEAVPSKEAHGVANAFLKVTYRSTCIISND